jgi:hypothetical protein
VPELTTLWEVHIRVPVEGAVAIACKRGGERLTPEVVRFVQPSDALGVLKRMLERFRNGDELFVTARGHDSRLSMWSSRSRSAGLYWCATAISQLYGASLGSLTQSNFTVA